MNQEIVTWIDAQREQFGKVVATKGVEFEREKGFALQILEANDFLMKTALGNPASLQNAVTNVAAFGVTLNPAAKLAYLIPRKGVVCLDLSYMGLMYIAQDCGAIQWGQAVVVREKDEFRLQGLDKQPLHVYAPFATDRGEIVGVYVVVKTDGGDYLTHAMPIALVNSIRDRSDAWRAYEKDKSKKCPWVTDYEEMVKKTCVKQAAKYWPRRERLDTAVHHLNTDGGEGINLKPNTMPGEEFEEWKTKIQNADTKEAAKAVWREAVTVCKELGDVATADKLKAALLAHAAVLDEAAANEKAAA